MRLRSWGETSEASAATSIAADPQSAATAARTSRNARERRSAHAWRPARFMVIAAHPDDADFGPAGDGRALDRRRLGGLAGVLHERRPGRRGPRRRPARAGRHCARREQRAAAAIVGYAGVTFLHQPDGALANDLALREQLVREIRTFRPDAVLATDPDDALLQRRRGQPHRPPRGRDRRRRRRLSGGPQPDGLPVPRPLGARGAQRPPAVPVLVGTSRRLGRRVGDARPQDRRAARPRQPDPRPRRADRADPRAGPPRRASRSASTAAEAFRLIVIDDDEDEGRPGRG